MEVHAHTHSPRKKWTHYFWEFLMLFLAVFCGFLAEYQLEHKIEHQREKEYIQALAKDLQNDTAALSITYASKVKRIIIADSVSDWLIQKDFKNSSGSLYYYCGLLGFRSYFKPNDGTIQQLRNSGGLRLIRKRNVVDSLQNYINTMQDLLDLQDLEEIQLEHYRNMVGSIFDMEISNEMLGGGLQLQINRPKGNPPLLSEDKSKINEINASVIATKVNRRSQLEYIITLKSSALRLIELIRKEYHVK